MTLSSQKITEILIRLLRALIIPAVACFFLFLIVGSFTKFFKLAYYWEIILLVSLLFFSNYFIYVCFDDYVFDRNNKIRIIANIFAVFLTIVVVQIREINLYAQIKQNVDDKKSYYDIEKEIETYHREIYIKFHNKAVNNIEDDINYNFAVDAATGKDKSVEYLRKYITENKFTLHKKDAQILMDSFYDVEITRLTQLKNKKNTNNQIMIMFINMLKYLKTAVTPDVNVLFTPTFQAEPKTTQEKEYENFVYEYRVEQNPELKALANKSLNKSAILTFGDVFKDQYIKLRETVILECIRNTVSKVSNKELMNIISDATKENIPVLNIKYKIIPDGSLFLFTKESSNSGLLRGYKIEWEVGLSIPSIKKQLNERISSKPLRELNYYAELNDPDWAPYAVIILSSFYDFSAELVSSFGFKKPEVPKYFKYNDATVKEEDVLYKKLKYK